MSTEPQEGTEEVNGREVPGKVKAVEQKKPKCESTELQKRTVGGERDSGWEVVAGEEHGEEEGDVQAVEQMKLEYESTELQRRTVGGERDFG